MNRPRPTTLTLWLSGLLLALSQMAQASDTASQRPTLTVYAYDAFTTDWGPGPLLKAGFEAQCHCELEFVALSNSATLLTRLRLEGANSQADVVLGLDANQRHAAERSGLFQAHKINTDAIELPVAFDSDTFVPFDYGYFAFIYNKAQMSQPPTSFEDLLQRPNDQKIIIIDPRTGTPGQGLLLWVKALYGDRAGEVWAKLQPKILTVTKGWSEAYFNLFLNGEAPMVLSYSTSPAYHMAIDQEYAYQAAAFDEGHYLQIELAAISANTPHRALAQDFLRYLISAEFQQHIPLKQVMYPVIDLGDALPEVFDQLIKPKKVLHLPAKTVDESRKAWINEWLEAISR